MVTLNNVYNNYSGIIIPKSPTVTKKSSELKDVYNNMVNVNKRSPLYKLSLSRSKQNYLINLKESALQLKDITDSFSYSDNQMYHKLMPVSDNEDAISVNSKSNKLKDIPSPLSFEVKELATEQINTGKSISSNSKSFLPGTHTFSISTIDNTFNFDIDVSREDSNYDIQKQVVSAINDSDIDINAYLNTSGQNSNIELISKSTGKPQTDDELFFNVNNIGKSESISTFLGLDNVTTKPRDSHFYINGEPNSSPSNNISINNALEVDFHESNVGVVNIEMTPDTTDVLRTVDDFIGTYNSIIDTANTSIVDDKNYYARLLKNEFNSITRSNKNSLESIGINVDEKGYLSKDEGIIIQSVKNGEFNQMFKDISSFKQQVTETADKLTINPIAYLNKIVVTYPNSSNNFTNPYTQSLYSGLLYNNYA